MNESPRFQEGEDVRPIARLREELGMTQAEFASALGVSAARPSLWELGREKMSPGAISSVCRRFPKQLRKLRISPLDLMEG